MGYTGLTPTSYWIWRPSAASVSDTWQTLVTEFESGAEQRRAKWTAPKATVTFQFTRTALSHDDVADIWRFYKKQQGRLRTFEVPTFGVLTRVASAYAGVGTALGLDDTQDLTTSATSRWNRIWVENKIGQFSPFTVSSVVNATKVIVSAPVSENAFAVGDPVYPMPRVRFAEELQGFEYLPALLGTVGVTFTEVQS